MSQYVKYITGAVMAALFTVIFAISACDIAAYTKETIMKESAAPAVNAASITVNGKQFISVDGVLQSCGYKPRKQSPQYITYYNNLLDIDIRFNLDLRKAGKRKFVVDFENKYILRNDILYVEKDFLGELINKNIELDHGNILLQDIETVPHDWINMSKRLIAHAGGGIGAFTYTNSYEAMIENYGKGHRVFELDFNLTSDGHLAAIHDWNKNIPLSLDEFKKTKARDYFTPIDFDDVAGMMALNKNMYIVTDTKSYDCTPEEITVQFTEMTKVAMRHDPEILKRIVVQIYNREMYDIIKPFQFDNIIYTLYASKDTEKEVIDFVKREKINVVTMAPGKLNANFVKKLSNSGAVVYVHTINDIEEIKQYTDIGVWGFYTDFLTPRDMP